MFWVIQKVVKRGNSSVLGYSKDCKERFFTRKLNRE